MWGYIFLQARSVNLSAGQHGAALEVRYRLHRTDGKQVPPSVTVAERIKVLVDTHGIAGQFRSGPNNARNGLFNDIYRLVSNNRLPSNFRFEVEQTYTANNHPVDGKNKVVYTASSVLLYLWERNRWRLRSRGGGRP